MRTILLTLFALINLLVSGQSHTFETNNPEMAKAYDALLKKKQASGESIDVLVTVVDEDGTVRSTKMVNDRQLVQRKGKFGYENPAGEVMINLQYDFGDDFHGKYAVVGKYDEGQKKTYHKWHIDRHGKPLYATNLYVEAHPFCNGYAIVNETGGFQMCHINYAGKPIYNQRYTYCWDFNIGGKAMVEKVKGKKVRYLVIDTTGRELGSVEYDYATDRADPESHAKAKKALAKWL